MSATIIFDDLFAFEEGICYLRVYLDDTGEIVALALQLDDNPGRSIVNAAEALIARIEAVFGGPASVFTHFPPDPGDDPVWAEVTIEPGERARFDRIRIPHAEIERRIGAAVPLFEAGSASASKVGGEAHPLLPLIPLEEEEERTIVGEMQVIAVADLPWPHMPSECVRADRFEAIRQLYDPGFDGHIPAGAHFFLSLSEDDFATCRYHQHDWRVIADASVELLESLGPASDFREVAERAGKLVGVEADCAELIFLFSDPIKWTPGATSITNGQHRTCALKAAGADHCVALTHGELITEPVPTDPRRRAQSALAKYWVGQLEKDASI